MENIFNSMADYKRHLEQVFAQKKKKKKRKRQKLLGRWKYEAT